MFVFLYSIKSSFPVKPSVKPHAFTGGFLSQLLWLYLTEKDDFLLFFFLRTCLRFSEVTKHFSFLRFLSSIPFSKSCPLSVPGFSRSFLQTVQYISTCYFPCFCVCSSFNSIMILATSEAARQRQETHP